MTAPSPERISRWFLPVTGELRAGGRFHLEGNASGTIEHIHLADGQTWERYGPGAVGLGWELGLTGLARHLAGKERLDPAAAQAWTVSEDGQRFVAESSDHWSEAAMAAGTDPVTARAWAARTTAFYTGAAQPD